MTRGWKQFFGLVGLMALLSAVGVSGTYYGYTEGHAAGKELGRGLGWVEGAVAISQKIQQICDTTHHIGKPGTDGFYVCSPGTRLGL
jgi:hypothetical protein